MKEKTPQKRNRLAHANPNGTQIPKTAYSIAESAQSTGMCERFLRRQCYLGKLEHLRIGRRVMITPDQLQTFLQSHAVKSTSA
jgi:hypothetical protein